MKIAVFGGTGRTGRLVIRQALDRGLEVVALARTPSKLDISDVGLTMIEGNAANPADVARTVAGADAVISTIAAAPGDAPGTMRTIMDNIAAAMQQHGVRRLIMTTGAGVADANDTPGLLHGVMGRLVKLLGGKMVAEMEGAVAAVRGSGIDLTVARAPVLTDGPRTGAYRVGYVSKDLGMRLSRADFADFLLNEVLDPRWVGKMPALSG
jgi:putative NADH-flavin reductase